MESSLWGQKQENHQTLKRQRSQTKISGAILNHGPFNSKSKAGVPRIRGCFSSKHGSLMPSLHGDLQKPGRRVSNPQPSDRQSETWFRKCL